MHFRFLAASLGLMVLAMTPRTRPAPLAVPAITALSPSSAVVGGQGITLVVTGTGFANNSKVRWQGTDRVTTFVSATELRATILAGDLATLGTPQISVFNQGGNGGTSNVVAFTVGNPVPTIGSLTPATGAVAGPTFSLQVNGTNFVAGSVAQWNGVARQTLFESTTRLSVTINASDIAVPSTAQVRIVNPGPGGGPSPKLAFSVAIATPVISSFSPAQVPFAPNSSVVLTVRGVGFINGSVVRWNGQERATVFMSPTELRASLVAADLNSLTTAQVTVRSTVAGASRQSEPQAYQVVNPMAVVGGVTTTFGDALRHGMTSSVTLNGSGFIPSTVVMFNDSVVTPSLISFNEIRVVFGRPFPYLGQVTVRGNNPAPGGGGTAKTVLSSQPVPILSDIQPTTTKVGTNSIVLTARGFYFAPGAQILVNNIALATTEVSEGVLQATLSAVNLMSVRSLAIRVRNPEPGQAYSGEKFFNVAEIRR